MENSAAGILDILVLRLKPGVGLLFDKKYKELSLPMLKKWHVHLIAFGPTVHEEDIYLVVRHYSNLTHRRESQDAYYKSDEWRLGPRDQIMSLVVDYTTVVIPANDELIRGFSRAIQG